jgi:hypothetical protein
MKKLTSAKLPADPERLIIGTWDWKYTLLTSRGLHPSNHKKTPETEGYTEQRRFRRNGEVEIYRDGEIIGTYSYRIDQRGFDANDEPTYRISIKGRRFGLEVSRNKLVIGNGGMIGSCGADSTYEKLRRRTPNDA